MTVSNSNISFIDNLVNNDRTWFSVKKTVVSFLLVFLIWYPNNSHALKCRFRSMEERMRFYDTIFIGVVTKIKQNKNYDVLPPDGTGTESTITFDVKRMIKGDDKEFITVQVQGMKGMWNFSFQENKQYLMYTQNRNGNIEFPVCGSTMPYNFYTAHDIEGDLKSVVKGKNNGD